MSTSQAYETIDEVVAFAASRIDGVTREDRLIFRTWVWQAEKKLGFSQMQMSSAEIEVNNLAARKPDEYRKLVDMALFDADGKEYWHKYRGYSPRNHEDLLEGYERKVDVYEDDNFFFLGSNGSNITTIKIDYYGLPLDEDGMPKIPEHHVFPISQFIKYLYLDRKGENQSAIQAALNEWKLLAAGARGQNKMPSPEAGREIAKEWMSMIAQPLNKNDY